MHVQARFSHVLTASPCCLPKASPSWAACASHLPWPPPPPLAVPTQARAPPPPPPPRRRPLPQPPRRKDPRATAQHNATQACFSQCSSTQRPPPAHTFPVPLVAACSPRLHGRAGAQTVPNTYPRLIRQPASAVHTHLYNLPSVSCLSRQPHAAPTTNPLVQSPSSLSRLPPPGPPECLLLTGVITSQHRCSTLSSALPTCLVEACSMVCSGNA